MDKLVASDLAAFTTPGPNGGLAQSSQNDLTLGLSSDGLDQINSARHFRNLFFGSSGNLSVRFSVTPTYLDPRALSVALAMDQNQFTYRHQPPRTTQFEWPPLNASGNAFLVVTTIGGQSRPAAAGLYA